MFLARIQISNHEASEDICDLIGATENARLKKSAPPNCRGEKSETGKRGTKPAVVENSEKGAYGHLKLRHAVERSRVRRHSCLARDERRYQTHKDEMSRDTMQVK